MADASDNQSQGLLPAGLSDLMPGDARREAEAIGTIMASFAAFGYDRVKPPLVEFEDTLLADGPGAALAADTFRVMDPQSSRMMAIRADMTAQIARIARTRLLHKPRPLRLSYSGDVLRIRPDPLNPERQLTQVGAEMIGASNAYHDAELAIAALHALDHTGVGDLTIDLGVPRLLEAIAGVTPDDKLAQAVAAKDHALVRQYGGKLADTLTSLLDVPMLPLEELDAKIGKRSQGLAVEAARMIADLLKVAGLIRAAMPQVSVTLDPLESRGFDYHHGIGFSIFAPGIRGELGRGGRYRTTTVNGSGEDSTGVTLYLERVMRALPENQDKGAIYVPFAAGLETLVRLVEAGEICRFGTSDAHDDHAQEGEARAMSCRQIYRDGGVILLDE
jgi:ATP phosphoribosyltransferase regulatory subunit